MEYEAKAILQEFGVPVPSATPIRGGDEVPSAPVVLKSQVHTGGRGKLGGVRVIRGGATTAVAKELFALAIKDEQPRTLLAEEVLDIVNEYYVSLVINRGNGTIELVAHREGGIEVESHEPIEFFHRELTAEGAAVVGDNLAEYFSLPENSFVLQDLLEKLYACFTKSDALLL